MVVISRTAEDEDMSQTLLLFVYFHLYLIYAGFQIAYFIYSITLQFLWLCYVEKFTQ